MAVRVSNSFSRSGAISSVIGIPATVEYRDSGTIVSPCPPSTNAVTFSTETFSSCAMNVRNRAESSTPAIPITRSRGNPACLNAVCAIASSGFDTTMMIVSGEAATTFATTSLMIL